MSRNNNNNTTEINLGKIVEGLYVGNTQVLSGISDRKRQNISRDLFRKFERNYDLNVSPPMMRFFVKYLNKSSSEGRKLVYSYVISNVDYIHSRQQTEQLMKCVKMAHGKGFSLWGVNNSRVSVIAIFSRKLELNPLTMYYVSDYLKNSPRSSAILNAVLPSRNEEIINTLHFSYSIPFNANSVSICLDSRMFGLVRHIISTVRSTRKYLQGLSSEGDSYFLKYKGVSYSINVSLARFVAPYLKDVSEKFKRTFSPNYSRVHNPKSKKPSRKRKRNN